MTHEYILWISLFAYALHIFEEKMLDWRKWSESVLKLKTLEWTDFYFANGVVIVTGICGAMVGWQAPSFALILPALQLINGIFFHIAPTIVRKKFSPGVITSVILFLPIALWAFCGAQQDGVLSFGTFLLSFVFAALLMTSPFIFIKLSKRAQDSM